MIDAPQPISLHFRMNRSEFQGRTALFLMTLTMVIGCESRLKLPNESSMRVDLFSSIRDIRIDPAPRLNYANDAVEVPRHATTWQLNSP